MPQTWTQTRLSRWIKLASLKAAASKYDMGEDLNACLLPCMHGDQATSSQVLWLVELEDGEKSDRVCGLPKLARPTVKVWSDVLAIAAAVVGGNIGRASRVS